LRVGALALLALGARVSAEAPPAAPALPPPASAKVDFVREVQPIFAARCVACHGARKQAGGLRLHRRRDALAGGDDGLVILPGKGAESRLVQYVAGAVKDKAMPPGGPRLTDREIGLLRAWIDQGASWPESADEKATRSAHWSFRPVARPPVPSVRNKSWVINSIDAFVLAKLEAKGIKPSPPADRATLIRRVSLDLTGLPPTPEEADAFAKDPQPGAYERLVDRLLASPHYGERWGRHWLDLARYADSNGYTIDTARQMWMYRDWVIRAFNEDMPFDRFTTEQLAGDLLPAPEGGRLIATGFHRNTLVNEEGGTDQEQFRIEAVVDRVNTTGTVWLGLTVGCAQCHSHKYDPISQREYYQLLAFFNSQDEPTLTFPNPEQARQQEQLKAQVAAVQAEVKDYEVQHPAAAGKDETRSRLGARLKELQSREKELAKAIPTALVMQEREAPRQTYVHLRGDFLRQGLPVQPGVPSVLPPLPSNLKAPNRLDLARWLVDPANPLTARVTVNRFWQEHFGRGLVETENDFGTQGTPPTHPELLDWLASCFARGDGGRKTDQPGPPSSVSRLPASPAPNTQHPTPNAWSLKALHRLIVTSATYRQSSRFRPELQSVDPGNRLLARQSRLRLDAEIIRDEALAASGLLCPKIGGPSVFPPQPGGTDLFTQVKKNWKASEGEDRYRRGMYTFHWRSSPYALFATFDAPNGNVACTRRLRSDTPTQALMLANDESFFEMAQALASRLMREGGASDEARVRYGFRRCLGREPSPGELKRLLEYYRSQAREFEASPAEAEKAAPGERPEGTSAPHAAAWTALARVLLNLDEFITRE
jgi:mono/diheme cytochrome c family protein